MNYSLFLSLLFSSNLLMAQVSFQEWQHQENQAFQTYQTNADRAFMQMLSDEWKHYQALYAKSPYIQPKPYQQPSKPVEPKPQELITLDIPPKDTTPFPRLSPKYGESHDQKVNFDLFSLDIEIVYDTQFSTYALDSISQSAIIEFWNHASKSNYPKLIQQLKEYQKTYQLNDWSLYLLINKLTQKMAQVPKHQTLLSWFLMLKLGIDTKVGYTSGEVALLVHTPEMIYGKPFFTLDNKRYYVLKGKSKKNLTIYQGHAAHLKAFSFQMKKSPILRQNLQSKKLSFDFNRKHYTLTTYYNKNLTSLYRTYPQLDYITYVKTYLSKESQDFIDNQLQPILTNMPQEEKINFLLRLTQNSFAYKTDLKNFGHEKVMFYEETLEHNYSDCEDRVIFFTQLIRSQLHNDQDIVLIKYPNHLATAIALPNSTIGGDYVVHRGKRYYIADPTYNNANIGQAMPQLRGQTIEIISL